MNEEITNDIPQRAVSLYGQNDGVEDFPVLKAFQQYIDAEQEKARKRVIGLGIFFGAILIVVVAVFMFLLHGINVRNQTLSDRLVEYAMKESERRASIQPPQPVVQQPSTENGEMLKAMTATLSALQQSIQKSNEEKAAKPQPTAVAADPVEDRRVQDAQAKIDRQKALLEAEKKKVAEERERLRQIEIDRQRRKLYPELYADEESRTTAAARTRKAEHSRTRTLTDEDIREIIREAYPEKDEEDTAVKKESSTKKSSRKTAEKNAETEPTEEDAEGAIEYFKDDDYAIPVDVKGGSSKVNFTVPVSD